MITIPTITHEETWITGGRGGERLVPPACMVDVFSSYIKDRMVKHAVADDSSCSWTCPSDDIGITYQGEGIWLFTYSWSQPHPSMTSTDIPGSIGMGLDYPTLSYLVWLVEVGERIEARKKLHRHSFTNAWLKVGGQSGAGDPVVVSFMSEFSRWVYRRAGRSDDNPLLRVEPLNIEVDRRRVRRPFTDEELSAVVAAARSSEVVRLGLDGPARAALYLTAAFTGFRASELASLEASSFRFHVLPPTVVLEARRSKRRRQDVIPLHPFLVTELQPWVGTRSGLLWPGKWAADFWAADLLMTDAEAARAAAGRPPLFLESTPGVALDFHSFRHTFITRLVRAGVHPKKVQVLARHSDIRLTMQFYSHISEAESSEALGEVPGLPSVYPRKNPPDVRP